MPPKKTSDGKTPASAKKTQEKKLKVKQLKPKLKTPTVIKIKIPSSNQNNILSLSTKEKTPKSKKIVLTAGQKTQLKLDLANEVAAAQLSKAMYPALNSESVLNGEPKKRGRKKKVVEPPVTTSADSETSLVPVKSKLVKQPIKRGNKKKIVEPVTTSSEDDFEASPAKKKCVRKVPPKLIRKKVDSVNVKKSLTLKKQSPGNSTVERTRKVPTASQKRAKAPESEIRTRNRKSKAELGKINEGNSTPDNIQQSPSILDQKQLETPKAENCVATYEPIVEPCPIDSRKTSVNSELSWTKDISSSSTTTCVTVCSTDFVRIDKKLPVLKLTNIDLMKNKTNNALAFNSESSDSKSSETSKEYRELTPEVETRSLDLSTSSVSPSKSIPSVNSPQNNITNDDINKISKALDKLTSKLKNFDMEIVNWIGYGEDVNIDVKKFQGKIFQVLKEESEVIAHCQLLKKVLSDSEQIDVEIDKHVRESAPEESIAENVNEPFEFNDHGNNDDDVPLTSPKIIKPTDEDNNFTSDKVKHMSFEHSCDDDDALSLFAESLTGIDSCKMNSSAASLCNPDYEEYIPQLLDNRRQITANKVIYQPTKIVNLEKSNLDVRTKAVCEKQNADSTSIYKDSELEKVGPKCFKEPNPENLVPYNTATVITPTASQKKVGLMASFYKPRPGTRSTVLRGICFFNLLDSCKNSNCRFPHLNPECIEITAKLVRLSEELFIQEYMLLRNWPILRRKYGMCFVEECSRRDLTRILVEMAIDFIMKANNNFREDSLLVVEVTERVLIHLNSVDLETCEDLLMYNLHQRPLCDVFMQAIANTQNFSRFKPVFMKLTLFILRQKRTFSLDVASQILERLSVLPCEQLLLEAMLEIVKHTDRQIVENPMMRHFENQLSVHKDLYECYEEFKKEVHLARPVLSNFECPSINSVVEPVINNSLVTTDREKRYTSPDTTHLDNMNKTTEEPIITRTIDFNRARFNIQRSFSNSNSSTSNESLEEFRQNNIKKNKPNFKDWRGANIHNHIPPLMQQTPRLIRRQVQQKLSFGQSPPAFTRRTGPDFF